MILLSFSPAERRRCYGNRYRESVVCRVLLHGLRMRKGSSSTDVHLEARIDQPFHRETAAKNRLAVWDCLRKAPPAMFACQKKRFGSLGRFFLALLLTVALLAAGLLSVSPALHEHLHHGATHSCAATLFASGHCEAAGPLPVFTAPDALPLLAVLPLPAAPFFSCARFFSLLEHAPPSLA